ncbi:nicotinate-nucleotide adenylyltransferase [Noviherbaspirillum galbum]|uniref:Probable nicotinate-nucleotide adenylyltransferase n=1 Tax=Noviherbaspirillum galbum TaxID=2709383 RepID=A0A6B3SV27_9BURK|nr:nicotinate-nucleotide adenylyltransferase [Noviherbaspirillum galbum]NEX64371.1 nicotinate-nucleotide adenylyltransferase [Noviherbaspirillum galbum]
MREAAARRCVAVLGGSFDPVHAGHLALASYFAKWLVPDELRILPAGNPWQKPALGASAEHRVAMARLAFGGLAMPVVIDEQEVRRDTPTYTIDTIRELRQELGGDASIAFIIGADQLQRLDTWKEWRSLFDATHLCVASRPGFNLDAASIPAEVAREFRRREASADQMRGSPHGLTHIATALQFDVAATEIRTLLQAGPQETAKPDAAAQAQLRRLLPDAVLDYIKQHHLYENEWTSKNCKPSSSTPSKT